MTLDEHLSQIHAESIRGGSKKSMELLKTCMALDTTLAEAAQAKAAKLSPVAKARPHDYATKTHLGYLREALNLNG